MEEKKENQFIDADRFLDVYEAKIEDYKLSPEILEEFVDAAKQTSGCQLLMKELREHHSKSPKLSAGDIDAAWDRADAGEETVGGSSPTPDQDVVDQLGLAVGLIYEDNEPLDTDEKIANRDCHRWELDPASSEGYKMRVNHEGEYEEK
ncbi:MAG TPA: DUF6335 family protein [Blastocatellia bacterium]|nr:DUF6335 family protein [Blastocatellia bacterium]